jgi:hypothetical protein
MSERDELAALRRLAELEARAQSATAAEDSRPQMLSDPTAGSGTLDRLLMGMGTAGTEMSQGFRQLFNLGDQKKLAEEIAKTRQIDAPFKKGLAGATGNVLGKAAPAVAAGLIPGAGTVLGGAMIGAGTGLVEPSTTDAETAQNVMFGGLGGGAATLVGRALPAVVGGLAAPFTGRGREGIVGQSLQRFAGDKADDVAKAARTASAKTPGWQPTLAEATMDPGIAVLERGAASADPLLARAMAERGLEQNAAALGAVQQIAGDSTRRAAAVAARESATQPLYQQAFAQTVPGDATIAKLMERPLFNQAMEKAKTLAANSGDNFVLQPATPAIITASGQPAQPAAEYTGKGLHYLKMALDDMLDEGKRTGMGGAQQRALNDTRDQFGKWIEKSIAPYGQARQTYAQMSQPINEMDVGKALAEKLSPALMDFSPNVPGKITAQRYAQSVRNLDDLAKSATGFQGATADTALSQAARDAVMGVGSDLSRRSIVQDMGRGAGSNTAQNLASQNLLRNIFGPMGMPESFIESTLAKTIAGPANMAFRQGAEPEIQKLMARAMLDPQFAAELLARQYGPGLIAGRGTDYYPLPERASDCSACKTSR